MYKTTFAIGSKVCGKGQGIFWEESGEKLKRNCNTFNHVRRRPIERQLFSELPLYTVNVLGITEKALTLE